MQIYTGFEIEIETKIPQSNVYDGYMRVRENILTLARNTEHITNTALQNIKNYHSQRTDFRTTSWRLEGDASLLNGAEFISPPEPVDISIEKVFEFFKYIDNSKCMTSKRCGLHVNMSTDNKTLDGIDIPTFITLINQRLLFKLWGHRMKENHHVRNMQNILSTRQYDMAQVYNLQNNINTKVDNVSDLIINEKYNFVNKRRINGRSYIEIRVIGGKDYHKKLKEIKQTIAHFAEILEQAKTPKQLHKKTYKKIISYVNRISFSNDEDIFIPKTATYYLMTDETFSNKLKQLENVHKYSVDELIRLLKMKNIIMTTVYSCNHTNIRKYFNYCVDYMYNNVVVKNNRRRETYLNYINYHYAKFIYNNFDKTQCLRCLSDKKLKKSYRLYLPENEPKRNLFWMLKLIRKTPPTYRKAFVDKLPIQVVNYILRRKISGFIAIAKTRKKTLATEETNS